VRAEDRIVKTTEENCHNTLEERLAEQDRISFKAGRQDVVDFCKANQMPDTPDAHPFPGIVVISKEWWQAKLKEWEL